MPSEQDPSTIDRFSHWLGRSRFIVLLAVVAVILVAISLFLLGTVQAVHGMWNAWQSVWHGNPPTTKLTVEFLEIVSTMLKAVVFYIIGVGLYSLFVAPLNLTVSLGVETLIDVETKVISVIVVILGVTFLSHFIRWEDPLATLEFGGSAALMVGALVLFQRFNHKAKEEQSNAKPQQHARAQRAMFIDKDEKARLASEEEAMRDAGGESAADASHTAGSSSPPVARPDAD
jgi:uncharacterized membrane protein YqhA